MSFTGKQASGFTLIELIVTLAIISILAAISLYSYSSQIEKTRLADARSALTEDAHFMERWYADNGSYKHNSAWPSVPIPETDHYSIAFANSVTSSDGNTYTLKAIPKKGNITNGAKYLLLDQDGNIVICFKSGGTENCSL